MLVFCVSFVGVIQKRVVYSVFDIFPDVYDVSAFSWHFVQRLLLVCTNKDVFGAVSFNVSELHPDVVSDGNQNFFQHSQTVPELNWDAIEKETY